MASDPDATRKVKKVARRSSPLLVPDALLHARKVLCLDRQGPLEGALAYDVELPNGELLLEAFQDPALLKIERVVYFRDPSGATRFQTRQPVRMIARRELEVCAGDRVLGVFSETSANFELRYDVKDSSEVMLFQVQRTANHWREFVFTIQGGVAATVTADKHDFIVEFHSRQLDARDRALVLAGVMWIDREQFQRRTEKRFHLDGSGLHVDVKPNLLDVLDDD